MKRIIIGAALAAGLAGLGSTAWAQSTSPAMAQHQERELARGEPARWMKADGSVQAQIATKRKEIGAALNEAMNDCKKAGRAERQACMREARATYQRDMANVKELVAQSNQMGGVYDTAGPSE
ncbi:hypothetical protein OU994_10685 [Pseudoduganella sp. SL102]|uniref:hypothetical protein n=1 Tax=Pseudoduganella sp. SL102 TaxID=2995154 RepID=UPI00248C6E74|nr:hypothetical protein [Pseudoduganella sp. SL102]WBS04704.1 hypothetical protein OU994_10685 [Pseudoduganella sp. SL102]